MNANTLLLVAHEAMCLTLFWSAFCRSAKAGDDTRMVIKLALLALGASALVGIGAPFYGWEPDWVTVAMLVGITAIQLASAVLWHHGVPEPFRITSRRLRRSRIWND